MGKIAQFAKQQIEAMDCAPRMYATTREAYVLQALVLLEVVAFEENQTPPSAIEFLSIGGDGGADCSHLLEEIKVNDPYAKDVANLARRYLNSIQK